MGKTYHHHSETDYDDSVYTNLSDIELDSPLNGNLAVELDNTAYRTRKNATKRRRHDQPDVEWRSSKWGRLKKARHDYSAKTVH